METSYGIILRNIHQQALTAGACEKFKGTETLEQLVELFKSPQGIEFCIRNQYPNTATFRLFKQFDLAQWEIYIDAGNVFVKNPKKAVFIGRTTATVNCDDNSERHEVVLLNGAKAVVNAYRWGVLFTKTQQGCQLIKNLSDNAIIL